MSFLSLDNHNIGWVQENILSFRGDSILAHFIKELKQIFVLNLIIIGQTNKFYA